MSTTKDTRGWTCSYLLKEHQENVKLVLFRLRGISTKEEATQKTLEYLCYVDHGYRREDYKTIEL